MASIAIKISFYSAFLSVLIYFLNANSIGSDANDNRNKMSLNIQEPNEDDYNPLSNQAIYLDKMDKLGPLLRANSRIAANFGPLSSAQLSGYENQKKRQIRYHQCYFNPISCFRKRK